jgi:hypothetical protein
MQLARFSCEDVTKAGEALYCASSSSNLSSVVIYKNKNLVSLKECISAH